MYYSLSLGKNAVIRRGSEGMVKTGNILLFFILLFSVSFYPSINTEATDNKIYPEDELSNIVKIMKQNNMDVIEWSVYTRGSLGELGSIDEYSNMLEELDTTFGSGFTWGKTKSENGHLKTIGKLQKEKDINEELTLIAYPENGIYKTYLVYKIYGNDWRDTRTNSLKIQIKQKVTQIFHETPLIFTCVKGQTIGKMNLSLYERANELLFEFSAAKIEELKERNFVSISAYTPNWGSSIYTHDKEMNIQISLRDIGMGGKTAVTIGTPIITSEY
jgi:hypothetical protein